MAIGVGPTDILNTSLVQIPNEILTRAEFLITLFQALGWLAIAYFVFKIISLFWGMRQRRDIKKVLEIVKRLDSKLGRKGK